MKRQEDIGEDEDRSTENERNLQAILNEEEYEVSYEEISEEATVAAGKNQESQPTLVAFIGTSTILRNIMQNKSQVFRTEEQGIEQPRQNQQQDVPEVVTKTQENQGIPTTGLPPSVSAMPKTHVQA